MKNKRSYRRYGSMISTGWRSARKWIASERLRRVRAILFQVYVLLALLGFAGLALLANTTPVFAPDVTITRDLQSSVPHWLGLVLEAVSVPGYGVESIILIVVVVAALAIIGLRWEAGSALFAAVASGAVNYLVKIVVHRPRPTANLVNVFQNLGSYSYPSGHVMFYTGFFGFLLFLAFTLLKPSWRRTLLIIFLALMIALVGASRMYLGEHWGSDVLGGYLLGSLVLIVSIQFYRWGKQRRVVQQPIAVTGPGAERSSTPEEKKELQQDINNPLLPRKEAAQVEHEERRDQINKQPRPSNRPRQDSGPRTDSGPRDEAEKREP